MSWEMYEVWGVDENGHEELIDTTKSFKEAKQLAEDSLQDLWVECIIYLERDGELIEEEVIAK